MRWVRVPGCCRCCAAPDARDPRKGLAGWHRVEAWVKAGRGPHMTQSITPCLAPSPYNAALARARCLSLRRAGALWAGQRQEGTRVPLVGCMPPNRETCVGAGLPSMGPSVGPWKLVRGNSPGVSASRQHLCEPAHQ